MKITEETIGIPCELKEKIIKKTNISRIKVEFVNGINCIFDKTNFAITKPNLIVFSNSTSFVKVFNYGTDELFVDNYKHAISLNSVINLVNSNL